MKKFKGPKVLLFDIETAPILGYVWSLWENNVSLNQIKADWHLLSWAAKWLDDSKVMYMDQRNSKDISDDKAILLGIWKLLNEADVVITQNGKEFDQKKLNARFILNGMKPPKHYEHIDTKQIAKRNFAFTSNKLEYMTDKLNKKYKKIKHEKFGGFELWSQCLKGDKAAFVELEKYNKYDVLSLEELYKILRPWDNGRVDFNKYHNSTKTICHCGSTSFNNRGFRYTSKGKYTLYICKECGAYSRDTINLHTKEKKKSLRSQ